MGGVGGRRQRELEGICVQSSYRKAASRSTGRRADSYLPGPAAVGQPSDQVIGAGKEKVQELLEESPLSHATLSLNFLRENFTVLFGEN